MNPFKQLLKLLKYRPGLYLVDLVIWILIYCAPLLPGILLKWFFDELTGKKTVNMGPIEIIVLFAVVGITRVLVTVIGGIIDIHFRFSASSLMKYNLFSFIRKKPSYIQSKHAVGDLISYIRDDVYQVENSLSFTIDTLGTALFGIFALIILFSINFKVTAFVFLPLLGVLLITKLANNSILEYRKASRKATAQVTEYLGEVIQSVQAIKLSTSEDNMANHLAELNEHRKKAMIRDTVLRQFLDFLYNNTINLGTGFILLLCAYAMKNKAFSIGDLSLFIYYLGFISDFIGFMGIFMANYQQTKISLERMNELIGKENASGLVAYNNFYFFKPLVPEIESQKTSFSVLEIEGMTYKYGDTDQGIENVDFLLKKGEKICLTGKIGSGKSTFVKVLLGILPLHLGNVKVNGEEILNPANFFQAPLIAYCPQCPNLIGESIKENIILGKKISEDEYLKIIENAQLTEDFSQLEAGDNTIVGSHGTKISGGQRQRIAIARMYACNPEIYLIDDMSRSLDAMTERKIWANFFEANNKSAIIITHNRNVLRKADKIVIFEQGKIKCTGRYDEFADYLKDYGLETENMAN